MYAAALGRVKTCKHIPLGRPYIWESGASGARAPCCYGTRKSQSRIEKISVDFLALRVCRDERLEDHEADERNILQPIYRSSCAQTRRFDDSCPLAGRPHAGTCGAECSGLGAAAS